MTARRPIVSLLVVALASLSAALWFAARHGIQGGVQPSHNQWDLLISASPYEADPRSVTSVAPTSNAVALSLDLADGGMLPKVRGRSSAATMQLLHSSRLTPINEILPRGLCEWTSRTTTDVVLYQRAMNRMERLPSSATRMACVYSGFVRDFARMARSCRIACTGEVAKLFGTHEAHMWKTTRCDIFMSTWDVHGIGGYRNTTVDLRSEVDLARLYDLLKDQLHTLHVQNYTLYQEAFRRMAQVNRHGTIRGWHPKSGECKGDYLRFNDYSQAYKTRLAFMASVMSSTSYDALVRLRPDMRVEYPVYVYVNQRRHASWSTTALTVQVRDELYVVSDNELHTGDKAPSDFAFIATPSVYACIVETVWRLCTARGTHNRTRDPASQDPRTVIMNYVMWQSYRSCATGISSAVWARISRRGGTTFQDLVAAQERDAKIPREKPMTLKFKMHY